MLGDVKLQCLRSIAAPPEPYRDAEGSIPNSIRAVSAGRCYSFTVGTQRRRKLFLGIGGTAYVIHYRNEQRGLDSSRYMDSDGTGFVLLNSGQPFAILRAS